MHETAVRSGRVGPRLVAAVVLVAALAAVPVATTVPVTMATSAAGGYWLVAADGGVFAFGDAAYQRPSREPGPAVVGFGVTPSGAGYWLAGASGQVVGAGDARDFGSSSRSDVAAFAARRQGDGYWVSTGTGTVDRFGDAPNLGGVTVGRSGRIVAMASTATGLGYWSAGADGGVFAFGDAGFFGSMGGTRLNQPIVAMAAVPVSFGRPDPPASPADVTSTSTAPTTMSATTTSATTTSGSTTTTTAPAPPTGSVTLVGAGDIAGCATDGHFATGALLDTIPGTVFTLGDNAYDSGTASDYACYDQSWGRQKARTRPAVGNHDYRTPGAGGYFTYFGATAGDWDKGYYSYDLGAWHVIVLNSNCGNVAGGCGVGSPQERWLEADLAASPAACTVAYFHHPLFNSGEHGAYTAVRPLWDVLYADGVELVLNGHAHGYERFAPQRPDGQADPNFGIREFVAGTGGQSHTVYTAALPTTEVRNGDTFGVLMLTLSPGAYDWTFVPVAGASFTDAGHGSCHAPPS